jgi:uncharacterized membrane protein
VRKIAAGVALYVAVLGALALWRWHIWTYGTDTGTFTQVVLDAFGGFRDGPEQGTHFRFHWAPLLAVLFPLVALTRSGLALQLAQIVSIALCAPALYALARPYVGEASALRIGIIPLLYPPLAAVAFTEFHEIAFYPAVALGLVWAADRARWGAFAALALCSALIREEACLIFAIVGCSFAALGWVRRASHDGAGLLLYEPREPRKLALAGVALVALNLGALGIYYGVVIPRVGPWQPSRFYDYSFAQGPVALVAALLTHPAYIAQLLTFGRLTYLLEAFVPLAFLPFRSRFSLPALPGLAIVLLASDPITWRMGSHYAAIWIPWLLLGTAGALVAFERRRSPERARTAAFASIGLCLLFLIAFDPLHPAHYLRPVYPSADAARALASLPPDAGAVATHDEWFVRIAAAYPEATVFYCPYVRYAVYADDYPNGYFQSDILPQIRRELASGTTTLVRRFGAVAVYRRTPPPDAHIGDCITPGDVRYRAPHA